METEITTLYLTKEYAYTSIEIMSNLDYRINKDIEQWAKEEKVIVKYPSMSFNADLVWKDNRWICEVFIYHNLAKVIKSKSLRYIMKKASTQF